MRNRDIEDGALAPARRITAVNAALRRRFSG